MPMYDLAAQRVSHGFAKPRKDLIARQGNAFIGCFAIVFYYVARTPTSRWLGSDPNRVREFRCSLSVVRVSYRSQLATRFDRSAVSLCVAVNDL